VRLLGTVLTPAELGFRAAIRVRNAAYRTGIARSESPAVPAISIGNITVGGTGKTPLVRWTVKQLRSQGRTPGILHGGYAGDEPMLHRRWFPDLPVIANRDRLAGASRALQWGADILVLDDAFQHRRLGRDLDIVLVAAENWTRYARILPRGPFREPPQSLQRADVVIVTRRTAGASDAARAEAEVARISGRPTARAHLRPSGWLDGRFRNRSGPPPDETIAAAGIARPADFFEQATGAGARLAETVAFPDHFDYRQTDAEALLRRAGSRPIVTTAKDAVKLIPLMPDADLWILEQEVAFEDGVDRVLRALEEVTR
jgi:tetraacyldisaccharide 4'-kinase